MRISDLLKMGFRNLFRRKIRTVLTVLGVIIGSLFIIITISIGHGMDKSFETQVKEYGSLTTISISSWGAIYDENGNWAGSKEQKLNDQLVDYLKTIDHVRAVTPIISTYVVLYAENEKYEAGLSLQAMDKEAFDEFEFPDLSYGGYPTEEDNRVIIFGVNAPYAFYKNVPGGWNTPVQFDLQKDKIILKFDPYSYSANPKKKEFALNLQKINIAKMVATGSEYDYNAYIDLGYFKELYREYCNTLSLEDRRRALRQLEEYQEIRLNVENVDYVEEVQQKIQDMGFQCYSLMEYIKPTLEASKTLQLIFFFLGAVSMFVSAISIANTMVMSIYERTKEIGIMKVLGCYVKDIRLLFLFEAGMIGFIGGVIGVGFSYLASFLINKYGQPLFGALMNGGMSMDAGMGATYSIIPPYLPFLGLGIAVGVGLLSGYFPARRATKISAIEAMRTEN